MATDDDDECDDHYDDNYDDDDDDDDDKDDVDSISLYILSLIHI